MKILIVTQYFWPEDFRINDLAIALQARGHQVTVLTSLPNYPRGKFFSGYGFFGPYAENYEGISVLRVPQIARGSSSGVRLAINYISFVFFSTMIAPFLNLGKNDVVFVFQTSPITQAIPALLLKKIYKIPIMMWVQDLWPESLEATGAVKSATVLAMVGKLVRSIYKRCDRILIQSKAFVSSIQSYSSDAEKIRFFPNSAEELYKPLQLESNAPEIDLVPKGFKVMFAGNIGDAQDFATILDAAENLRSHTDIHWVILGDGRMKPWVEEQVRKRNLTETVHLLGRHSVESMPRFFSLADVMLVTLKQEPIFALTIPAKIQSYLACAKPIIAALDGEGGRVVTEAKAGFSCPAQSPDKLASAVLDMYKMTSAARNQMGMNGKIYFEENFSRDKLVKNLEAWMKEIKMEKIECAR